MTTTNTSTTVGGSVSGQVGHVGDDTVVAATLTSGLTYNFSVLGKDEEMSRSMLKL